ncbi:NADPH-dependent 2,4-dienoyl-CoA reductase, sulfur reductase, or a related oxidoreductase [Geosmithia morbida]|uniref:NADPH-dependent 2,4-dienoyl-CoA reductase, sulfur reductase, or a related oxidoreductase n=1 Tax=Geosmithia morbida TaxID=1094350 RepID=A0A9P5D4I7_9HYPO|nr:NADPH-dependent 2,4-dienoyl-CoA reductase, sulfur reductase, or a related oxidoreductase [Geosmithia morbida]KAF4123586.1 NADPH-dependent 2,4-dienoyl-CoA reductase, sulfur reductase, or a related oxidoreductase [Geosmithia morbida]
MGNRISKIIVLLRIVAYSFGHLGSHIRRQFWPVKLAPSSESPRNIVIIGASFAGYHAARLLASSLPADGSWKLVIIEPNTHYQFTWTLPRFCVVSDHEDKAFIPYGGYLPVAARDHVRWLRGRATGISRTAVSVSEEGRSTITHVPYEYLVIATGAGVGLQLPSRVGATDKETGCELLRQMQRHIRDANRLVVIGGGAAGVELATDAKSMYPHKTVTLVHSRQAVMHRFGPELQAAAFKGLEGLGVDVVLNQRAAGHDGSAGPGCLTLTDGRKIEYDFCVNCGGQKPASQLLSDIAPNVISESGHIRIKPTLQVDDESLPKVYACGDVAETSVRNPNSRSAMRQAEYAADNIVLAALGRPQTNIYKIKWADGLTKLTLGLSKSVIHLSDDKAELLIGSDDKDETLMSAQMWKHMGAKPFIDDNCTR